MIITLYKLDQLPVEKRIMQSSIITEFHCNRMNMSGKIHALQVDLIFFKNLKI